MAALIERAFGHHVPVSAERTVEGIATQVYRLTRNSDVFYLRVAEEEQDRLTVAAELFRHLRDLGIHVPEVVFVEPFDATLRRSVMITTEIPGHPLANVPSPEHAKTVARAAGRELGLINQVELQGFGFVRRDGGPWPLVGQFRAYSDFVSSYLPDPWPGALPTLFEANDLDRLQSIIDAESSRPLGQGRLAHGDFDITPIFHVDGRYTGLIDFGEIRGTEPLFDLGHFLLHDCETYAEPLIDDLVVGYQEVTPLPSDFDSAMYRSAVLLGLRQLCRWMARDPSPTRACIRRALRLQQMLRYVEMTPERN